MFGLLNNINEADAHVTFLLDINECNPSGLSSEYQHLAHICHDDANCTNTKGSYYCACLEGYSGSGEHCTGKFQLRKEHKQRLKTLRASLIPLIDKSVKRTDMSGTRNGIV